EEYIALLEGIEKQHVESNASLKLTQMGLDLSEQLAMDNVSRILERARAAGNFIRIDMEGSAYTERTIDLFQKLRARYENVGVVLQAYLHRTEEDAKKLAAQHAPIRVCKGAYKEPPEIALQKMEDIRQNYKRIVEILLKGGSKVGIATHDDSLIRWAV